MPDGICYQLIALVNIFMIITLTRFEFWHQPSSGITIAQRKYMVYHLGLPFSIEDGLLLTP